MSRKQEIYQSLLMWGLPHVRNVLSYTKCLPWWNFAFGVRRRELQACYEVAELLHNLYVSILDEDFTDHDLWFLNVQARSFCQYASAEPLLDLQYVFGLLDELFRLVPADKRSLLQWAGPGHANPCPETVNQEPIL